jgi:hypothetical protein
MLADAAGFRELVAQARGLARLRAGGSPEGAHWLE